MKDAPIRFGTSGWRGVAGEDFTPSRIRAALHAVGGWLAQAAPAGEVVLAHDTRPGGADLCAAAEAILAAHGARVVTARGAVPTPVAARAVAQRGAAAAVVFTASHNAPEYRGIKVFGPGGGGLEPEQTRCIEALADRILAGAAAPPTGGRAPAEAVDLVTPYLEDLLGEVDGELLRRARVPVVYDAMHGAGAGVLDRALAACGLPVRTLRSDPDPHFGGAAPDPRPERLRDLVRAVRAQGEPALGFATDGDADRFAVVDAGGRLLSETDAVALLVDHLARAGRIQRGVAVSLATGSLVARVAAGHGLRIERHPIGFKHLSRSLLAGSADAAGEESGGFALGRFGSDKDGILAACLMAELRAELAAPLAERLAELTRRYGPSHCARSAVAGDQRSREALARLAAAPPERVDGARVLGVTRLDGVHLALDDGFLMLRASGTEPLVRIYAEARGPRLLKRRLAAGGALLSG